LTTDWLHPLNRAIKNQDLVAVRELLAAGHDVTEPDKRGVTPVQLAASRGNTAVLRLVLEAGADPSAQATGGWGWPPLARAVVAQSQGAVALLLKAGADPTIRVLPGAQTLTEFARRYWPERTDIIALLENAIAKIP